MLIQVLAVIGWPLFLGLAWWHDRHMRNYRRR